MALLLQQYDLPRDSVFQVDMFLGMTKKFLGHTSTLEYQGKKQNFILGNYRELCGLNDGNFEWAEQRTICIS